MKRRFSTTNSFLDMLFNILLSFFMLFAIALLLINPPVQNRGDIELKAEFLITMEWPGGDNSDVDLLLQMPNKEIIFYDHKDGKAASLDRDDQGHINDVVVLSDGSQQRIELNWEHIAIRKMVPGRYVVNLLMFSKRSVGATPVTVKIEKLNPYGVIYAKTIPLTSTGQEKTVVSFKIDKNGRATDISTDHVRLINKLQLRGGY